MDEIERFLLAIGTFPRTIEELSLILEELAKAKIEASKRKVTDKQIVALNKSALHLLLLMCKKLLLRVGAKERDDIVPKVSKLKTLDDQLNVFKAILSSDFQPAIEKDAMFKFITNDETLEGKTVLYTMPSQDSPENGELSFVGTLIGYNQVDRTWSMGLNMNSKNVVHTKKLSTIVASLNSKQLTFFDRYEQLFLCIFF